MMSDANLTRQIKLPWVSFGSDAASMAPEPPFTRSSAHPRAYGNFARVLGKYVRDEKALTLADAVHRLSGLPATNLELRDRGFLRPGMFADVVVFDPRDDRRQGDVREAAPVRRGRSRRARQRHRRAAQRRTHECPARPRALRAGEGQR